MKLSKNKIFDILLKKQVIESKTFFKGLFLLVLMIIAFIYGFSFTEVNDGFWHIKAGEYILKNKTIPYYDIFSWYGKSAHLKWINHEWLFGVISYIIYSIHGFLSVSIFMGIINVIIIILLYKFVKIRCENSWTAIFCASFYVLIINRGYIICYRPMMISIVLILITCILLERKKYILALVIMTIGINVHGGIYPVYIIIFAYYTLVKNYKYFIASFLCVFINPYTYRMYLYTIKSFQEMGIQKSFILEWKTVPLYDYTIPLIIIIITVFTLSIVKINLREIIFLGAFMLLSISAKRQMIFLPIIVLPVISKYLNKAFNEILYDYVFKIKIFNKFNTVFKVDKAVLIKFTSSTLLIIILMYSNINYCYNFFNKGMKTFEINPRLEPVYAVQYINKHPEIKNSHLLNHYNDSQYLIFEGIPTFVDSRVDLFLPSYNNTLVMYDYILDILDGMNPQHTIYKYKINYILISKSDYIYTTFKKYNNLKTIYSDKNYCIFKVKYYVKK
ncbi:MAG: hypothetical protein PHX70_12385 [Clostridium sp.]|nr:hypothetical protein [Clostridium sp.]